MKNFIRFIINHNFTILFILLEIFALILIINFNKAHRNIYISSSSKFSGFLFEKVSGAKDYFKLKQQNKELNNEIALLRTQLSKLQNDTLHNNKKINDKYNFFSAKVINNTIYKRFNYITLNKGSKDGIHPDMGIINNHGIIGIVIKTSENYSTGISLLNPHLKVSAKIEGSNFFGTVSWEHKSILYVTLDEIPEHANIQLGDKVITSGYSSIFPENILIGTISNIEHPKGESFLKIKVKLSVNFANLNYVNIINNKLHKEQIKLEKEVYND